MNGIFENTYMIYEILEKFIRDYVNADIDVHKLNLFLWKYMHECMKIYFWFSFKFFIFLKKFLKW